MEARATQAGRHELHALARSGDCVGVRARPSGFRDPVHRLFSELVKGGYGEFEMLFFRVLDFVVADAVEALDEHHDGGNPRRQTRIARISTNWC